MSRSDFTKNQILEAAAHFFNERGFNDVAAQAIATEVGMSLGNLQYHFKTKRHIILAMQPRMESEIHAALSAPPMGFSAAAAAEYHVRVLRTLWRYRFFFNALPDILSSDSEVRSRYERFNAKVLLDMRRAFDHLIKEGAMAKIVKPNSTELIAWNLWICLIGWLKFEQVKHPRHATPERAVLIDAALQNLSLLQLYFPPNFTRDVMMNVRRLVNNPVVSTGS